MKITIIEVQTSNEGSVAFLIGDQVDVVDNESTMNALSVFYTKCAYAAISICDLHTVMMVDNTGRVWNDCYATFAHGH